MPMIPEAARNVSLRSNWRDSAWYSEVLSGGAARPNFGRKLRVSDYCGRGVKGQTIPLKHNVDLAVEECRMYTVLVSLERALISRWYLEET